GAGIFFGAEDQGVFVQPVDLTGSAREFRESVRFATMRADQPNLHRNGIWFGLRAWPGTEKGDPLAIRGPARRSVAVSAASELNFAFLRQAGKVEIGREGVLFFVAGRFDPGEPFGV